MSKFDQSLFERVVADYLKTASTAEEAQDKILHYLQAILPAGVQIEGAPIVRFEEHFRSAGVALFGSDGKLFQVASVMISL